MRHVSAAEYRQLMLEQKQKPSKHRNRFVYVYEDGFVANENGWEKHGAVVRKYDSVKEFQRHKELELLQKAHKLSDLQWQVPILIKEGFEDNCGKKHRPIFYKADFVYQQGGKTVVEDVKGIDRVTGRVQTTEAFRLKWKLLMARYPEWEFRIY